jgi:hypothetical protein
MVDDINARLMRVEQFVSRIDGQNVVQQKTLDSLIMQSDQHDDFNTGFAISTAGTVVLTSDPITVPNGFTHVKVIAVGTVCAVNSGGTTDLIQIEVGIDGTYSSGIYGAHTPAGAIGAAHNHQVREMIHRLAGDTFTCTIRCTSVAGNWAANGINTARLSTFANFLRV